jgi:hypothetical protein
MFLNFKNKVFLILFEWSSLERWGSRAIFGINNQLHWTALRVKTKDR